MVDIHQLTRAVAELQNNTLFEIVTDAIIDRQSSTFKKLMYDAKESELPSLRGELKAYQEILNILHKGQS